jgi:NADH:ubiquinone oxidoreductase subunit D
MSCDLAYARAVEQLLQVEPPPRAQALRVIYAELQRVASHLFWLAGFAQRLTDPLFALPAYAWQGRTRILEHLQWLGGNPITPDVIGIGGLTKDMPPAMETRLEELLAFLDALLDDLECLLSDHNGWRDQIERVGVIDPGTAMGLGVTGPNLRACGIRYDVRSAFPYGGYGSLDIEIPVRSEGDAHARYLVRMGEMRASLSLVRQAASSLPGGPVNAFADLDLPSLLPVGTVYASVEGARGELGILIVSDGSAHPQRVHIRGPSFANLSALSYMTQRVPTDQVTVILDSLDISMGEAER